jgi:uncharacterized OB-fold protein
MNMPEGNALPFTIESFYKFVGERRLMAAKCVECGTLLLPPRPTCVKCSSKDLRWIELLKKGRLITYTVIHTPPVQFQSMAPYVVGIVKLVDGPMLPGMIRNIKPEEVKIDMNLKVDFDATLSSKWPMWPRYFFRPL